MSWYQKGKTSLDFSEARDSEWQWHQLGHIILLTALFPYGTVCHVVSAETVNTFKNRLDKFWLDQEVLYDYKTDLHGIGNRSIV